jgi:hypothetical protein
MQSACVLIPMSSRSTSTFNQNFVRIALVATVSALSDRELLFSDSPRLPQKLR